MRKHKFWEMKSSGNTNIINERVREHSVKFPIYKKGERPTSKLLEWWEGNDFDQNNIMNYELLIDLFIDWQWIYYLKGCYVWWHVLKMMEKFIH